jgi:hypothetical protein
MQQTRLGYLHDPSYRGSGPAAGLVVSHLVASAPGTYRMLDAPILDQAWEDCTGNGFGKAIAAAFVLQHGLSYRLAARHWLYWHARRLAGQTDQDAGAFPENMVQAINEVGFPAEDFDLYGERGVFDPPSLLADQHAFDQRADVKLHEITGGCDELISLIKSNVPCVWCGEVDQPFMDGPPGAWVYRGPGKGGHAVAVLGCVADEPEIDNSWSTSWANGGRCVISRETINDPSATLSMWAVTATLRGYSDGSPT